MALRLDVLRCLAAHVTLDLPCCEDVALCEHFLDLFQCAAFGLWEHEEDMDECRKVEGLRFIVLAEPHKHQ